MSAEYVRDVLDHAATIRASETLVRLVAEFCGLLTPLPDDVFAVTSIGLVESTPVADIRFIVHAGEPVPLIVALHVVVPPLAAYAHHE